MLPLEVLQRAGAEITNYGGSGMSVMEMSHRSKIFLKIFDETQEKIPEAAGCARWGLQGPLPPGRRHHAVWDDPHLAGQELPITPAIMNYKSMIDKDSMYNTPPCWCIYMLGLMCDWLEQQGGAAGMEKINQKKAQMLYDVLDNAKLFTVSAEKGSRSHMNVTFRSASEEMDAKFVAESVKAGTCVDADFDRRTAFILTDDAADIRIADDIACVNGCSGAVFTEQCRLRIRLIQRTDDAADILAAENVAVCLGLAVIQHTLFAVADNAADIFAAQLDSIPLLIGVAVRISGTASAFGKRRVMRVADNAAFTNLKGHRSVGGMRASIYNRGCGREAV